jgi:hypothetical protein
MLALEHIAGCHLLFLHVVDVIWLAPSQVYNMHPSFVWSVHVHTQECNVHLCFMWCAYHMKHRCMLTS